MAIRSDQTGQRGHHLAHLVPRPSRPPPPLLVLFLVLVLVRKLVVLPDKVRVFTTPLRSKSPFHDSVDAIPAEMEVTQRWTLCQDTYKTLYPICFDQISS